jgi:hypothetical protein
MFLLWAGPDVAVKAIICAFGHTDLSRGGCTQHEEPFRAWFSKIGELRSVCPKAQMIALTATSGPAQRRNINEVRFTILTKKRLID